MSNPFVTPVAKSTPFDPAVTGKLTSEDVQAAIDELAIKLAQSASPGFTWGRSGNIPASTWLSNDSVPSNTTGRQIGLNSAKIEKVFVSNELANTFNLEVYEHDGATFTLLHTVSMVAQRSGTFTAPSVPVTTGKELAVKLSTGSAKNIVVGIVLSGSL